MEELCYGWCSHTSPAAEGWLLACTLRSLCSLDQTAQVLMTAWNPYRLGQKQVGAHRRKCPLATATDHPQATSETANVYQDRSHPPRPVGQGGSDLAADPRDRATRYPATLPSGALPHVLETQVKGLFPPTKSRRRNDRLDQADGQGQSALGC